MVWLMIVLMAVVTYANRVLFLLDSVKIEPSPKFNVFLSYSAYAVLTAIWAPIVFSFDINQGFGSAGGDFLLGTTVAAVLTLFRVPSIMVVLLSIGVFAAVRFLM